MKEKGLYLPGGTHAVLLIHGLTGGPLELKYLARKIHKAGFTVKVPWLAGHGTSQAHLAGTTWQDWYATVREAFDTLQQEHRTVSVGGLCMGALLALHLAYEKKEAVSSTVLLSTTLFYDGWSLPWYRFILPVSYYPPFKYFYSYEERPPYGIKNERLRQQIALALKENMVAYSRFPAPSMHELFKLIRKTKKIIPLVQTPALILHALEDDVASIKNADYVEKHIGSKIVRKVYVEDSYHMITMDNRKEMVATEAISFIEEAAGLKEDPGRLFSSCYEKTA